MNLHAQLHLHWLGLDSLRCDGYYTTQNTNTPKGYTKSPLKPDSATPPLRLVL